MTSRYRVEYSLKQHRRDYFIEWIKALLAVPFVLHGDAANYCDDDSSDNLFNDSTDEGEPVPQLPTGGTGECDELVFLQEEVVSLDCKRRYAELFTDIERLIDHTIVVDNQNDINGTNNISRLRKLVPSIGRFFTRLPLREAFLIEDIRRGLSRRRLVAPSFNDIRTILNTAQVLSMGDTYRDSSPSKLKLITFDGDVTLYEDGKSLHRDDEVVKRLVELLRLDFFVAVVTAAGYPGQSGAENYYERLKGLIDSINSPDCDLTETQKSNLLVMGGESNYLFRFDPSAKGFKFIDGPDWYLPLMQRWDKDKIDNIMETTYTHLIHLQKKFRLENDTTIIRKERSVGIIPNPGFKILREYLEEMVLSCSSKLSTIIAGPSGQNLNIKVYSNTKDAASQPTKPPSEDIRVCAFNGGSDVWVDIGDKSLGVESLQHYLCRDENNLHICPILKSESLHIGDQFASVGANDFKARLSACTVWIASPTETVAILDDLISYITKGKIEA